MIRFGARSEADEAEDAATFDLGKTASKSEVEAEVRRSGNWTTLLLVVIVGFLSVALVMCVAASVGVYYFVKSLQPPAAELAAKKPANPPKEIKARIKEIDRNQNSIRLLVGTGKYQTYQITAETQFFDAAGERLPQGLAAPQLRQEENVTILPTEDQQALQWLKLRAE
jgi:hypothetical protein